jgi:phosphopantothenoylcysteine decarboxylase/phosphopantothenate--cysteine ligase
MLKGKTILLGITGGIAAYKSCELVSRLVDLGADVWVVMTKEATKLVGPVTFRTLSHNPVITDLFAEELSSLPVPHISLADKADLLVIAPITANTIGKIAQGIADDPLTTIAMSTKAPKLIAPAMNPNMWNNPIVKDNCKKLKTNGYQFIGPMEGKLACGDWDIGRMAEPKEILEEIINLIGVKQDLKGKKILVTAGGTRENIDPVRFISNRSSGKMGRALVEAAEARGAEVILISAPDQVKSAEEMHKKVAQTFRSGHPDFVIMAAAVSDYSPKVKSEKSKVKRTSQNLKLEMEPTADILAELGRNKGKTKLVGFALETEDQVKNAKLKMKNKNLDLIVANDASAMEADSSAVKLISRSGKVSALPQLPKTEVANRILDAVLRL